MAVPALHVRCASVEAADAFNNYLKSEGVDTELCAEGAQCVVVPTDNPGFAWEIAEIAVRHGWARDDELSAAVGRFNSEQLGAC